MRKRAVVAVVTALTLVGCSTVTVRPQGGSRLETAPTHTEKVHFFLYGLVGEGNIDVRAMCGDKGRNSFRPSTVSSTGCSAA